jgi:hypothetical protein
MWSPYACETKMAALASLNTARSSLTHRDTVTQEVEDDVFQENFSLPVGLDHTKYVFVLACTHLPIFVTVYGFCTHTNFSGC